MEGYKTACSIMPLNFVQPTQPELIQGSKKPEATPAKVVCKQVEYIKSTNSKFVSLSDHSEMWFTADNHAKQSHS
uniref:Uncharacterized protein n=1 Tax=Tanacetum cinerariifolium TaxID=118510 RepID=A0A699SLG7_TANCI|nr:hypothetical protein [Tanacetum cinerariifolium]